MKKWITLGLTLLISLSAFAQNGDKDIAGITAAVQNYFDGYVDRDIDKLNKAFDTANGTMKVPAVKNGQTTAYENRYFKELMPIWGNREKLDPEVRNNCALEILNMDVVDSRIATARISMKVDKMEYIDMLSLQKIEGQWKITNKIYVARERQ